MPKVHRTRKPSKIAAKVVPLSTTALIKTARKAVSAVPPSGRPEGLEALSSTSPKIRPMTGHAQTLPPDSKVRSKALQIVALRADGFETPEIAKLLGIKPASVSNYLYVAGQHGWLSGNPVDKVEYELSHKVVRNLNLALDDEANRPIGKDSVTLAVAKGTMFKRFNEVQQGPGASNLLAIKIEVAGKSDVSSSIESGAPRYIEGAVHVDGESEPNP